MRVIGAEREERWREFQISNLIFQMEAKQGTKGNAMAVFNRSFHEPGLSTGDQKHAMVCDALAGSFLLGILPRVSLASLVRPVFAKASARQARG
jgi:hypothetical protein